MRARDKAIYRLSVVVGFIFVNGIIFSVLSASNRCDFSKIHTKPTLSIDTAIIYIFISLASVSLFGLQAEVTLDNVLSMISPIGRRHYFMISFSIFTCITSTILMFACWLFGVYNLAAKNISFNVCPLAEYTFMSDIIILAPLLLAAIRYCYVLVRRTLQTPRLIAQNQAVHRIIYRDQYGNDHRLSFLENDGDESGVADEGTAIGFNEILRWIQFLHDNPSFFQQQIQPQQGLSEDQMRQLKRTFVKESSQESSILCSICLDEIVVGTSVIRLDCEHLFHVDCLADWLTRNATCPNCKQEVRVDWDHEEEDEEDDIERPLISAETSRTLSEHYQDSIASSYLRLPVRDEGPER